MSTDVTNLYRYPWIHAPQISRMEEKELSAFILDVCVAEHLGMEPVGVFVSESPSVDFIVESCLSLPDDRCPGDTLIIAAVQDLALYIANKVSIKRGWSKLTEPPGTWRLGSCVFTTPEQLKSVSQLLKPASTAAVFLLDPDCIIHKARKGIHRTWNFNDRPQLIADFRADFRINEWAPPFFFFTEKRAKSINTQPILRAYCLEAWWFLNGNKLRIECEDLGYCD